MTIIDLTMQERHQDSLLDLLTRSDGSEAAAYMLLGQAATEADPWERESRLRLTSHEVIGVPSEDVISASPRHITWSTSSFVRLCQRAYDKNLVPCVVHSHPGGYATFSEQDYHNENELLNLLRNRNGEDATLASVVLIGGSRFYARLWSGVDQYTNCRSVSTVGKKLSQQSLSDEFTQNGAFERQSLAFGIGFNAQIRRLKAAVVGCGGTGSATAMLLARLGVGGIALFDGDIVEDSNLNRLHGARKADADAMRLKPKVLAKEISNMGLGVRTVPICEWVGSATSRNVLKCCDVIFGCTDDHDGRLLLNRFAYFYLRPVIDMGLSLDRRPSGGFYNMSGRVTVLVPGTRCLLCRGVVDPRIAGEESLRRANPGEYERRRGERYIHGGGDPAPAVVTLTTETACMAVGELLQGITDFRNEGGWTPQRVRRFDLGEDRRQDAKPSPCPICVEQEYWGRGDVVPFLDRTG